MKLNPINGFEFYVPTSGGKAGGGRNKTSNIQLRRDNMLVKQFRFVVDDPKSRGRATQKAMRYAINNPRGI